MTTTRSLKINQVAVVLWFNQFTEMDHHTSGANKTKWISTRNLAYLMRRWCFVIFFLVKLIYSLEHTFKVYIYIYIYRFIIKFFFPKTDWILYYADCYFRTQLHYRSEIFCSRNCTNLSRADVRFKWCTCELPFLVYLSTILGVL